MPGSPQSDDQDLSERLGRAAPDMRAAYSDFNSNSDDRTNLEERELEAALQLLVERAQYITGATGTALALPQGDEMVCRASAGACAPTVGARLQVRSGLTGESIARRQLLRCDNAEADPRVNLETCRALGIASIVVLPLLRRTGEVRGLFELFSDHPYAFEERDLVALERMAALTITALDLAEQGHDSVAPTAAPTRTTKPAGPASGLTAGTLLPGDTDLPDTDRRDTDPRNKALSDGDFVCTAIASRGSRRPSCRPSCRRVRGRSCSIEIHSRAGDSFGEPRSGAGNCDSRKSSRSRGYVEFLDASHPSPRDLSAHYVRAGHLHAHHVIAGN